MHSLPTNDHLGPRYLQQAHPKHHLPNCWLLALRCVTSRCMWALVERTFRCIPGVCTWNTVDPLECNDAKQGPRRQRVFQMSALATGPRNNEAYNSNQRFRMPLQREQPPFRCNLRVVSSQGDFADALQQALQKAGQRLSSCTKAGYVTFDMSSEHPQCRWKRPSRPKMCWPSPRRVGLPWGSNTRLAPSSTTRKRSCARSRLGRRSLKLAAHCAVQPVYSGTTPDFQRTRTQHPLV